MKNDKKNRRNINSMTQDYDYNQIDNQIERKPWKNKNKNNNTNRKKIITN